MIQMVCQCLDNECSTEYPYSVLTFPVTVYMYVGWKLVYTLVTRCTLDHTCTDCFFYKKKKKKKDQENCSVVEIALVLNLILRY